jgi:hypothetical protein
MTFRKWREDMKLLFIGENRKCKRKKPGSLMWILYIHSGERFRSQR